MKMLFYSSDGSEAELISKEFAQAGIACELRNSPAANGSSKPSSQRELWIQDDNDCHRAFMLCVRLGIGFAKRAAKKPAFHIAEIEPVHEVQE
jgi:hypothetical protein